MLQYTSCLMKNVRQMELFYSSVRSLSATQSFYKNSNNKKKLLEKSRKVEEQNMKNEYPLLYKICNRTEQIIEKEYHDNPIEPPLISQALDENFKDLRDDVYADFQKDIAKKETVFIIQPLFKWGKRRHETKLYTHRLDEAISLVGSIENWNVHSSCVESIHEQNRKIFFGAGKVLELSERVSKMIHESGVTTVFVNVGRLSVVQLRELQTAWGCKVFDRYRVVLELFKERAKTKEAKLQVKLAEIQYLRSHLSVSDGINHDQQRGGGKSMSGGGETLTEKRRRVLNIEETKIKKILSHIREHYVQVKLDRVKKCFPHVALIGYTNAGKTTLTKVLSDDASLHPENKLFATLDSTAHRGQLPSGLNLIYTDTVGFISDLPHELIESFSTTLHDLKSADLLLHVCDCSHPEFKVQQETVRDVLTKLKLPPKLLQNMVHVFNKADLRTEDALLECGEIQNIMFTSAVDKTGVEDLKIAIEEKILTLSGRNHFRINIDQAGGELSWLYRNGTVLNTFPKEDGSLEIVAILDTATRNKFEMHFKCKIK